MGAWKPPTRWATSSTTSSLSFNPGQSIPLELSGGMSTPNQAQAPRYPRPLQVSIHGSGMTRPQHGMTVDTVVLAKVSIHRGRNVPQTASAVRARAPDGRFNPWRPESPQPICLFAAMSPPAFQSMEAWKPPTRVSIPQRYYLTAFQSMGAWKPPTRWATSSTTSSSSFNPWGLESPQLVAFFAFAGGVDVSIHGGGRIFASVPVPDRSEDHLLLTIFLKASLNSR